MLDNTATKFTAWKETHKSYNYWKIVKVTAYGCKHTRTFQDFWETLSKETRNVEYALTTLPSGKLEL